eukprot:416384-Hanusia_phi.AAC.1
MTRPVTPAQRLPAGGRVRVTRDRHLPVIGLVPGAAVRYGTVDHGPYRRYTGPPRSPYTVYTVPYRTVTGDRTVPYGGSVGRVTGSHRRAPGPGRAGGYPVTVARWHGFTEVTVT